MLNIDGFIGSKLQILDALGTLLLNTTNTGSIDISSLKSGIYFIKIFEKEKDDVSYIAKFIKD